MTHSGDQQGATRALGNISGREWRPGSHALQDAWFPVAHSATVTGDPVLRIVHSQRYFIWRDAGRIYASDTHPNAAPSYGEKTFTDAKGMYPAIERYGHIWVWYGDAQRANPAFIPDIPFLPLHRQQPRYSWGVNFFHCTYELVLENILDLTHIDFVHGAYAGNSQSEEDSIRFESTSETVTMIRTIRGRPTSDYQRDVLGVTERKPTLWRKNISKICFRVR